MNLLIYDLKTEEWNKIAQNYATNWQIISDNGAIRSCNGCFGCWDKDPGRCVVHDGYENMGYLIHHAEEVVVISKYTYGGFSSFVKNVFDRSLGYLLPHFEVINVHHNRESHHKKRYDESKPFTFIFYGHDINEEQKQNAGRYVDAVCTNARGKIKDLIFSSTSNYASASRMEKVGYVKKNENDSFSNKPVITNNTDICIESEEKSAAYNPAKNILLNASMRVEQGNSARLMKHLECHLNKVTSSINLADYLEKMEDLVRILSDASNLVLCIPLYWDGLPSQLIKLMEIFERNWHCQTKRIYVLANMGLYENRQMINLFSSVREWCQSLGLIYAGGLGIGAAELPHKNIYQLSHKNTFQGIKQFCEIINHNDITEDIYIEPYLFPRFLYILKINSVWKRRAKKNGITPKDLYRHL